MDNLTFQQAAAKPKKTQKHLFWAVFLTVCSLFTALLIGHRVITHFSESIHPLLSEKQEFYSYFKRDLLNASDFLIIEEIVTNFLSNSESDTIELLSTIMQEAPVNTGIFTINSQAYYFVEDKQCQNQEMLSKIFVKSDLASKAVEEMGNCYTVFSQKPLSAIDFGQSSRKLLKIKRMLISKNPSSAVFAQPNGNEPLIGFIHSSADQLVLRIGELTSDFSTELGTKEVRQSLFSLNQVSQDRSSVPVYSQKLTELGGFAQFFGEFTIYQGDLVNFTDDKYNSTIAWSWLGSSTDANRLKEEILNELADKYPVAVEQVLPDETIIMELHEDKNSFLSIVVDENGNEKTLYTYPDGQIQEIISGNLVSFTKDAPSEREEIQNNCVYPDALGFGHISNDFIHTNLWKTALFSYDQQKMILCFVKNT